MSSALHYSPTALLLRSAWMVGAAVVVLADYIAHANGGFPHVLGLGFVPSAVLLAIALYFVATTVGLTLALMRHGCVAISETDSGITIRTAWFAKTLPWTAISLVTLDVRYGKSSHHTVILIRESSGVVRGHAVDTRLLAETLDRVSDWVEAAERHRIALGGTPYAAASTGLAGYNARVHAADIAADVAAAKRRAA